MEFKVIPNEQTPKVAAVTEENIPLDSDVYEYIEKYRKELEAFLKYTMLRTDAVGLAANQLALDGERFMVRAFALRDMKTRMWSIVVDPIITKYLGYKEIKAEGCLTWKSQSVLAERSLAVEVDYYDMDSNRHSGEIYMGFDGQIWQHEVNHLNGVPEQIIAPVTSDPSPINVGRNDLCPCDSGKKFKKCCIIYT